MHAVQEVFLATQLYKLACADNVELKALIRFFIFLLILFRVHFGLYSFFDWLLLCAALEVTGDGFKQGAAVQQKPTMLDLD